MNVSGFRRSYSTPILFVLLTACGGQSAAQAPGVSSVVSAAARTTATLQITIPKASSATSASRRVPAYVSPSTQSAVIDIKRSGTSLAGFPQTMNLTASSTGCSATALSTVCSLSFNLGVGSDTVSITTFSGAGGTGSALSTAQTVPLAVSEGVNNIIAVTLGGIPVTVVAVPTTPGYMQAAGSGLRSYGKAAQNITVEALDAGNNIILGPGAPTITVTANPSIAVAIAGGGTSTPNTFQLTPATTGTPAIVTPGVVSLTATATPVSGSAVSAIVPLTISHSYIYVKVLNSGVNVFIDGNSTPSTNLTASTHYGTVSVDATGALYSADEGPVEVFPQGSSAATTSLTGGSSFAVTTAPSSRVFVLNFDGSVNGFVSNVSTGQTWTSPVGSLTTAISGITSDPQGNIFAAVSDNNFNYLMEIPAGSGTMSQVATFGSFSTIDMGVTSDAFGNIYMTDGQDVYRMARGTTTPVAQNFTGLPSVACAMAVDAAGTMFVSGYIGHNVVAYPAGATSPDGSRTLVTSAQAVGIAVVPAAIPF